MNRLTSPSLLLAACAVSASVFLFDDAGDVTGLQPTVSAQAKPAQTPPRPVRNDVVQPRRELAVLRNHQLRKGGHEPFFAFSRDGLWPYFDRIGARVVGQWKVIDPASQAADREDVYRLTRYASFDHWLATRSGNANPLGGDGPAWQKGQAGVIGRADLEVGSAGAYFLEGQINQGGPYFMPALPETYRLVGSGQRPAPSTPAIPVRADVAQPGQEVVELRYQRIRKGTFDDFVAITAASIWPWDEKLGARPIGQWKVVHPQNTSSRTATNALGAAALRFITTPSRDYDEVVTLTRYGSRTHREALSSDERAMFEGGNGPDWQAWKSALERQKGLTISSKVEVLEGFMYLQSADVPAGVARALRTGPVIRSACWVRAEHRRRRAARR